MSTKTLGKKWPTFAYVKSKHLKHLATFLNNLSRCVSFEVKSEKNGLQNIYLPSTPTSEPTQVSWAFMWTADDAKIVNLM